MKLVELFSKHDCHLCEEAKVVLARVRGEIPFMLKETTIYPEHERYEEFNDMIPVVLVEGRFAFKYRINEAMLKRRLLETTGGRAPSSGSSPNHVDHE